MSTETFNWEEAQRRMREGKFVARKAWIELDMYIWYMPEAKVPADWCKEPHLKRLAERNGGFIECLQVIRMKLSGNRVKTGWFAEWDSTSATDWVEVHP
jgi:hypothetical protein